MGTGIRDMIARCRQAGLPEPRLLQRDGFVVVLGRRPVSAIEAVAPEVTPEVTPEVAPEVGPEERAGESTPEVTPEVI